MEVIKVNVQFEDVNDFKADLPIKKLMPAELIAMIIAQEIFLDGKFYVLKNTLFEVDRQTLVVWLEQIKEEKA